MEQAPSGTAGRAGPAANVGRWFSTARGVGSTHDGTASTAWGPSSSGYGLRSDPADLRQGLDLLTGRPTLVLTGAGMSTGSGLPDYRGPDAVPRSPMTYGEFVGSDLSRRRYWARSTVGWTQFRRAHPNAAHLALAGLSEPAGPLDVTSVVTQNVDGLHQQAGSRHVVDLHGRLHRVRCLHCDSLHDREALHQRMLSMNPQVADRIEHLARDAAQAPDGDAEVDRTADFRYPVCTLCGGMLKPDVVFFGEQARREVVAEALVALNRSSALLVLGSSLTVMSGLRFARRARAEGKDIVIVGDGPTRGDDLATLRLHGRLEEVLGEWAERAADEEHGR